MDWICDVEDVYYFESSAFWGRNPGFRALRENWYQHLAKQYQLMLKDIQPVWSHSEREATSFQILTLTLGCWTTLGNTRPMYQRRNKTSLKKIVIEGVKKLIVAA